MPRLASIIVRSTSGRLAPACLAALALTLTLAPAAARAQCPESSYKFPTLGPLTTGEPTFDVDNVSDGTWVKGDHTTGVYSLHHNGSLSSTAIVARDRFDVTGVPPGTAVPVTMRLVVDGWAYTPGCGATGCCGTLTAWIRTGTDTSLVSLFGQTFLGRADFSGAVEVPVTFIAGTPRELEIEMSARRCAGGNHTVDATGRVSFDGSDPDAKVASCKGYGPRSVPALRRSWGELKLLYR